MNVFQKAVANLVGIRHVAQMGMMRLLRRTRFDYRKEVGDMLDASVVTAPVQWVQRSLPEARLTVRLRKGDGSLEERADHQMLSLIQRPNAYYGDLALWSGTVFSYLVEGNSYWIKLRNGVGRPGELWWVPHWTMEPKGSEDGSIFIERYEYRPGGGQVIRYAPSDIVHFRHGIDPHNPRKGLSPLSGVIREIFMDLESSNFVASLLRNMGTPGMVISPKNGGVSPDDVAATKAWIKQAFGGDRRGEALVMGAPTDVYPYGFNPQQMNMSEARDVAEERVCASIGIPAAVVGFGAGLQSTKVGATMEELRKLAWQNGVLPVGRVFADELDRSLLPDFGNPAGLNTWWDTSEVQALQDDRVKAAGVWKTMIDAGFAQLYDAAEGMGLPVDDSLRVYLRPAMALETPAARKALPGTTETKVRASREHRLAGRGFVLAMERQHEPLAKAMGQRLTRFFAGLGSAARKAARPLLDESGPAPKQAKSSYVCQVCGATHDHWLERCQCGAVSTLVEKSAAGHERKSDDIVVAQILEALDINAHRTALGKAFEGQYLAVAKAVSDAAELAGISSSLPDQVARSVVAAGGRRAGIIDLDKQSREALFEALADGRAQGEGAEALAARIAEYVEAGPWASVETRARTIARTETKYAQNISTLERAKAAAVDRFIVYDGRLGPGRSLPDHIARDGIIVTAAVAEQMAADEHPNGTLSFAPYFGED